MNTLMKLLATKRKHPRRAISVKAETLARLRIYAKSRNETCSGLVEEWIAETLPSESPKEAPP